MAQKRQATEGHASSSRTPAESTVRRELGNRRIVPTKFVDEGILEELGIRDEVFDLFHRLGWQNFIDMHAPTYAELTREFFETFDLQRERTNWRASFVLNGRSFTVSLQEIREILRLPRLGDIEPPSRWASAHNRQEVWESLNHRGDPGQYSPSSSKASSLSSPAWRYVHKFFVSSICARLDSPGNVTLTELWFFDCITQNITVDPTYVLLEKMFGCANRAAGGIAFGGFVTLFAQYLHAFRGQIPYEPVVGPTRVDADTLSQMELIIKWGPPLDKWVIWWPPEIRETRLRARYNAGREDAAPSPNYNAPDLDDNIPLEPEFFQDPPFAANNAPLPHPDYSHQLEQIQTHVANIENQFAGFQDQMATDRQNMEARMSNLEAQVDRMHTRFDGLQDQLASDRRHIDHQYAHMQSQLASFFATYAPPPPSDDPPA